MGARKRQGPDHTVPACLFGSAATAFDAQGSRFPIKTAECPVTSSMSFASDLASLTERLRLMEIAPIPVPSEPYFGIGTFHNATEDGSASQQASPRLCDCYDCAGRPQHPEGLLCTAQVAMLLNKEPRFVRTLLGQRRIVHRKVGRSVRFHRADVDAYIESVRQKTWAEQSQSGAGSAALPAASGGSRKKRA